MTIFMIVPILLLSWSVSYGNPRSADGLSCKPCRCYLLPQRGIIANCSRLSLKSVPKMVPRTATELLMDGNDLNHLPQRGFHYFSLLQHLDLSNNHIESMDVTAFDGLGELLSLDLHGNSIKLNSTSYPVGLFQSLGKLEKLDISKNDDSRSGNASYSDRTFADLVSLKELIVDGIANTTFGKGFGRLKNLTRLTLSGWIGYCSVFKLSNISFIHVSSVKYLDISNCKILEIEANSYWPLRNIHILDMSYNRFLRFDNFGSSLYGLRYSKIKVLNASWIVPPFSQTVKIQVSHIQFLNDTNLEELYIDGNQISSIDALVPTLVTKLKRLYIRRNLLMFGLYVFALDPLVNLEIVDGSFRKQDENLPFSSRNEGRKVEKMFRTRRAKENVIRPNFHKLNGIEFWDQNLHVIIPLPPHLSFVNYSHGKINRIIGEATFTKNNVKVIDMSYNAFTSWLGPLHNAENVTHLDLYENYCSNITPLFLSNFRGLRVLNISRNYLWQSIENDVNGQIFDNQGHLEILQMSDNGIRNLPSLIFKNLKNLTKLDLNSNELSAWLPNMKHMANLQFLDISKNRFEEIPKKLREELERIASNRNKTSKKLQLRIKGNSFKCDCNQLGSLKWLVTQRAHIQIDDMQFTKCTLWNSQTVDLENIEAIVMELQKHCHTTISLILGTVGCITVFLIVLSAGIIYRYRWKLRYLYYTTRRKHKGYQRLSGDEDNFTYDAFVSYADEDRSFVVQDMRDMLERRFDLKLCIHHRDFMVGEAITANIINAVQSSRKTIVVLSPNFLKSSWCDYEVHMAKLESIHTGRDVLCVVWYADIPDSRNISGDLLEEMANGTYIQYPADEADQSLFWRSLRDSVAMGPINSLD